MSSPASVSSSTVNGWGAAELSILSSFTATSTCPVFRFAFSVPCGLNETTPLTAITNSFLMRCALVCISEDTAGLKTICTMPVLSLKSTNTRPPWSLLLCTQPMRMSSCPTSFFATSLQYILLFQSESLSKTRYLLKDSPLKPTGFL